MQWSLKKRCNIGNYYINIIKVFSMLSVNKPLMDAAFNSLCIKGSGSESAAKSAGIVYKSAYEAYYKKIAENLPTSDPSDPDVAAKLKSDGLSVDDIKKKLEKEAHDFASLFADAMKECLSEVSNQIDAHVKAVANGLTITMMPQGLATVVSPMGPCTGSMVIKNGATASVVIM